MRSTDNWIIACGRSIWSFYPTALAAREDFDRAKEHYQRFDDPNPCGIMRYDEFTEYEAYFYANEPLVEITEEQWDDMFECMPPLQWCMLGEPRFARFFCAEAYSGIYHSEYLRRGGKYYTKIVNILDPNTYIENYHKQDI